MIATGIKTLFPDLKLRLPVLSVPVSMIFESIPGNRKDCMEVRIQSCNDRLCANDHATISSSVAVDIPISPLMPAEHRFQFGIISKEVVPVGV